MNGRQCTNVNNIKTFAVNSTDTVNENIVKIKIKKWKNQIHLQAQLGQQRFKQTLAQQGQYENYQKNLILNNSNSVLF